MNEQESNHLIELAQNIYDSLKEVDPDVTCIPLDLIDLYGDKEGKEGQPYPFTKWKVDNFVSLIMAVPLGGDYLTEIAAAFARGFCFADEYVKHVEKGRFGDYLGLKLYKLPNMAPWETAREASITAATRISINIVMNYLTAVEFYRCKNDIKRGMIMSDPVLHKI
jgi:hypothetical protein